MLCTYKNLWMLITMSSKEVGTQFNQNKNTPKKKKDLN